MGTGGVLPSPQTTDFIHFHIGVAVVTNARMNPYRMCSWIQGRMSSVASGVCSYDYGSCCGVIMVNLVSLQTLVLDHRVLP